MEIDEKQLPLVVNELLNSYKALPELANINETPIPLLERVVMIFN